MADGGVAGERWYRGADLAGLPGLPSSDRRIRAIARGESWKARPCKRRGGGLEYALESLPAATQAALLLRERRAAGRPEAEVAGAWTQARIDSQILAWHRATHAQRDVAERRMRALLAVNTLVAGGLPLMKARSLVAGDLKSENLRGSSVASLARWSAQVDGAPQSAWCAILVPAYSGRTTRAKCDEQCWEWYKGHYLTRAKPSRADTYARLALMAREQGWTIPSASTLSRRMDSDVPHETQVRLREGAEAAARLIPTQRRDVSVFIAGEAVNGDGLKFDRLWVRFEDGEVINTATAWVYQDLRTRKIIAWRLGKTESTDLFRLATYDLAGVCAPKHLYLDNTRVAANKLMTAGVEGRHRFGDKPQDGKGLLPMLGITVHFTNPDKVLGNSGAKPIERAFGNGGIHHAVATHPRFINRGYSTATAIDVAELRAVLAEEIARHNAKEGRRTQICGGTLSFDQAWELSVAQHPPRQFAESQRQLLLMSREIVRAARPAGVVTLKAGRGPHGVNSYWTAALTEYAGQKLAAHFDPDNLSAGVHLYSLDGRYLFAAEHRPSNAFNSTEAAREYGKFKARANKAGKKKAAAEVRMDDMERAALYAAATGAAHEPAPRGTRKKRGTNVTQVVFASVPNPERDAARAAKTGTADYVRSPTALLVERLLPKRPGVE